MPWMPKKRVVVPVDFSTESLAAVDTGLDLVGTPSDVSVIHVLPDLSATEPAELWEAVDHSVMRDRAEQALRERLADARYEAIDIAILFGDPGQAIVDFAQERDADLIVIPSHGRSGWKRLILGSVAERVVRLAECPVLVLRADREG